MCPHPTPWDKQDWCRRVNKRHYHRAVGPVFSAVLSLPAFTPCPFPVAPLPVRALLTGRRSAVVGRAPAPLRTS